MTTKIKPTKVGTQVTKEWLLTSVSLRREWVSLPELGADNGTWVREMTGTERDQYESDSRKAVGTDTDGLPRYEFNTVNVRARVAAMCICDEAGKSLLGPADAAALGNQSAAALDRVFTVAMRLSGIIGGDELLGN